MISLFRKNPNEEGQGLVEYALILVLIAIVVIGVLLLLGPTVSHVYCRVTNAMQPGSCGVIASYEVKHNSNLKITATVTKPATVTVTLQDNTYGEKTKSQSCTPSSCDPIVFGGGEISSGSGVIATEHDDYITFSY